MAVPFAGIARAHSAWPAAFLVWGRFSFVICHSPGIGSTSRTVAALALALRTVIRLRKQDESKRREEEAVLATYLHALGMAAAEAEAA